MSKTKDGGPASHAPETRFECSSLRDWFAGQALPIALEHTAIGKAAAAAALAYRIADAMLAERTKERPS